MDKKKYANQDQLEYHVEQMLGLLGEDVATGDLKETPRRVAKALYSFSKNSITEAPKMTTFKAGDVPALVVIRELEVRSMCAHHLFPFFGKATVAYMAGTHKVGLSKMQRALDYFARRFTDQETITENLADFLSKELKVDAIAVRLSATHTCMVARGVECTNSITDTYTCLSSEKLKPNKRKSLEKRLMNLVTK